MAEPIGLWQATYTPGNWIVLGGPTSLVILQPAPAHVSRLIRTFWDIVVRADSLDALVEALAQYHIERMPDFAAFFWHEGHMRSLLRGSIEVLDAASGRRIATGEGVRTWTETGLGDVRHVLVELEEPGDEDVLNLPLVVGAVTASAVELDAREGAQIASPQAHAAPARSSAVRESAVAVAPLSGESEKAPHKPEPAPVSAPVASPPEESGTSRSGPPPANPFGPALLEEPPLYAGPPAPSGPSPRAQGETGSGAYILGVTCAEDHANPPEAERCRRCGGPLQGQPRMMPRPVMATLRPSNGRPVDVDRRVLVGRSPQANQVGREQLPRLLTVVSPSHDISRTHLQVSPEGWEVEVTDLHSTNGTLLIRPGQPEPERLLPGTAVKVYPGCVIDLGDGVTILVDQPA